MGNYYALCNKRDNFYRLSDTSRRFSWVDLTKVVNL